jgi:polar amino acid transport system substrate-binding protein
MKIFILLLMLLTQNAALAQTSLKLAAIADSSLSDVSTRILTDIFKHAGIDLSVVSLPARRASTEARIGELDGETARNGNYADAYPELVRIDPSYYAYQTSAFVKTGSAINITKREDLLPYRIGIVRGVKTASDLVLGASHITEASHVEQLLLMLRLNRFDIAIASSLAANVAGKKLGIDTVEERTVLSKTDLFVHLHVKHQALVPLISQTILTLKKSGELAKIIRAAEQEVLNRAAAQ